MAASSWKTNKNKDASIGNKSINFYDCLEKFFSGEKLDINNKVECGRCLKQNQATMIIRMKSCKYRYAMSRVEVASYRFTWSGTYLYFAL